MRIIVAVDQNWAIGNHGKLLYHISADLQHFKSLTHGACIVYGRKTLATFPHQKPLPGRDNIVLTHDQNFHIDALCAHNLSELRQFLLDYPTNQIYIIGGASIYQTMLPYCDLAYVTKIEEAAPYADSFFPNLDQDPSWQLIERGDYRQIGQDFYHFDLYRNQYPLDFLSTDLS